MKVLWRKFVKTIKFLICFFLLLIFIALISLYFWSKSESGENYLKNKTQNYIQSLGEIEFNYKKIKFDILSPSLIIKDLMVRKPNCSRFLYTKEVEIYLSLWNLLKGNIVISSIELSNPEININLKDGKTNIPELNKIKSSTNESKKSRNIIREIGINNGSIVFKGNYKNKNIETELNNINLDVSGDKNSNFEIRLLISSGMTLIDSNSIHLKNINARVNWSKNVLSVRFIDVNFEDGFLKLAKSYFYPDKLSGEFNLSYKLPLNLANIISKDIPMLIGKIQGRANLVFNKEIISAQTESSFNGLAIGEHKIGDISIKASLDDQKITVQDLKIVRPENGGVITSNSINLDLRDKTLPINSTLEFDNVQFATILEDSGMSGSRVMKKFSGNAKSNGTFNPIKITGVTNLDINKFYVLEQGFRTEKNFVILFIPKAKIITDFLIDDKKVDLIDSNITLGDSRYLVNTKLGYDNRFYVKVKSPRSNLENLDKIANIKLTGIGNLFCNIEGLYTDPLITGGGVIDNLTVENLGFGNVSKFSVWSKGRILKFLDISTHKGNSDYFVNEVNLNFTEFSGLMIDASVDSNNIWWHDVRDVLGINTPPFNKIDMFATGNAKLTYRQYREKQWEIEPELNLSKINIYGEKLDNGQLHISYKDADFDIYKLTLNEGNGKIDIKGHIYKDSCSVNLNIENYSTANLDNPKIKNLGFDSRVYLNAKLEGTLENPIINADLRTNFLKYKGINLPPLSFVWSSNVRSYEAKVYFSQQYKVNANGYLIKPYPINIEWNFKKLDLSPLLKKNYNLNLILSSNGNINTNLTDFEKTTTGYFNFPVLYFEYEGIAAGSVSPVKIEAYNGWYQINKSIFNVQFSQLEKTKTKFQINGGFTPDGPNINLFGSLNLGFLTKKYEQITDINGNTTFNVSIGGDWANPLINGNMDIDIPNITTSYLPFEISNIKGNLFFNRDRILIEKIKGEASTGSFSLEGEAELKGYDISNALAQLKVQDINYNIGKESIINFDSDMQIIYNINSKIPLLQGDIWINRLRYKEPIDLGIEFNQLGRHQKETVYTYNPGNDRVKFQIGIHERRDIELINNIIEVKLRLDENDSISSNSKLSGGINLVGTDQAYGMMGRIVVEPQGFVYWRNIQFEILRGIMEFENPYEIDPYFDFLAVTQRRNWRIYLMVRGTKSNYEIKTYSEPQLTDDDILFLITIGLTRQEIEQMGTTQQFSSFISEVVFDTVGGGKLTRTLIPIMDEFRISTEYSPRSGRPEPRIILGKKITNKVKLGASSGFTGSKDFKANVEVQITDDVSVEGTYDNNNESQVGNIGADIKYRIDF